MLPDAPRIVQLVAAAPGWESIRADMNRDDVDAAGPVAGMVSRVPVVAWALVEQDDPERDPGPIVAIIAPDHYYVGVPNSIDVERGDERDFIGYLAPGRDLEDFRGAVLDHYEVPKDVA